MEFNEVARPSRLKRESGLLAALIATATTDRAIAVPRRTVIGGYYSVLAARGYRLRVTKNGPAGAIAWCEPIKGAEHAAPGNG